MNERLLQLGKNAKSAETELRNITTNKKNEVLEAVADHLVECTEQLLRANASRCRTRTRQNQMPEGLVDRLLLTRGENRGNGRGTSPARVPRGPDR